MIDLLSPEELDVLSQQEQDEYWMRYCFCLAARGAELGEVPVGAVLVQDNRLLAEAFNQPIGRNDPCAHAEILVLREGGQQLENYRLSNTCLYVSLEPCSMCAGALVHARVERLVYGASEPKAGAIESKANFLNNDYLNHRVNCLGGVLAQEASEQLSAFFKRRRKEKKATKLEG
ncbi:tRNA adenosine(34) deaminase TadA [uncultured Pseudoteredinibacter sp.]|uniref:tRNA adenosine(34) deaminase TadA n=1 Tax=uncultured Pseudoteredinibacter sp. TaxID=1641701 RepID=UPI00260CFC5F|nr:tRNA adenosine(34) deaminase TadA [uncultured Pseudoteredinibacter sp.]